MSGSGQGGRGGIGPGDTVGRGEKLVCAHTRVTPVSPGAVSNTSSLFTYDSRLLVYQFENGPKHNPNFKPLFPDETTLSPSQTEDVAKLCEGDHFCILDVMSTGSSSVGNATRIAHQLHQHRLKSLQPGRGWEGTQGVDLSDHLAHPPSRSVAGSSGLSSVLCPYPSGILWLATRTCERAQGRLEIPGRIRCPIQLQQWLQLGGARE